MGNEIPAAGSGRADDFALLAGSVAGYCERALPRARLATRHADGHSFARDARHRMAARGWTALSVRPARGGPGRGLPA